MWLWKEFIVHSHIDPWGYTATHTPTNTHSGRLKVRGQRSAVWSWMEEQWARNPNVPRSYSSTAQHLRRGVVGDGERSAGVLHPEAVIWLAHSQAERTPPGPDSASWMKHVRGNVCATDAMCCRSESQIRITSSGPGAAVDVLTLTLSHGGLARAMESCDGSSEGARVVIHSYQFQARQEKGRHWQIGLYSG